MKKHTIAATDGDSFADILSEREEEKRQEQAQAFKDAVLEWEACDDGCEDDLDDAMQQFDDEDRDDFSLALWFVAAALVAAAIAGVIGWVIFKW